MELLIALVAALYTAGLAIREADRLAPAAPARTPVAAPEAGPTAAPAPRTVTAPDADRLIQTEVLVPAGSRETAAAFGRLAVGLAAMGLVMAVAILGAVRGVTVLLRTLSGG